MTSDPTQQAITELICRLMQRHKVTRRELADRLSCAPANITQILGSRTTMQLGTLSKILTALGYKLEPRARPIVPALTAIAEGMLAPCECERGDRESPSYYCGCTHRTLEIVEVLTDVAKRLPESMDEWKLKTTWEHWEDHKWKDHD